MGHQLVWFKRDLRVTDHQPLYQATTAGPTLCLFIYEPELIEASDFDAAHLDFINQSLLDLRRRLRGLCGDLILRRGTAEHVLETLCREHRIERIWAHEETTNWISYQRDRRVRAWAKRAAVPFTELPQYGVVRRLPDRDGWADQWTSRMRQAPASPPDRITPVAESDSGAIQTATDFNLTPLDRRSLQVGGETEAIACLQSFLEQRGQNYRRGMSSPVTAGEQCSRISPFLAYGNLSMRVVYQATNQRMRQLRELILAADSRPELAGWQQSLVSFQARLRWHCHFMQKMEDQPTIEFENMNSAYDGLREDAFDQAKFQAWCDGQTGYPMVDACMRALHQTGWINFRMRAMLVSFASYHLWLHWPQPALHLARLFLDYEPGIHYSQVQMQSGVTGINTVRIYSPVKQVADQDPHGEFIRRYVPELEQVPDHLLPEPHKMTLMEQALYGCRIGKDYPAPIVEHAASYKIARDRIHGVKRSAEARQISRKVQAKHGSRRRPGFR